jgi:hypothetical protein
VAFRGAVAHGQRWLLRAAYLAQVIISFYLAGTVWTSTSLLIAGTPHLLTLHRCCFSPCLHTTWVIESHANRAKFRSDTLPMPPSNINIASAREPTDNPGCVEEVGRSTPGPKLDQECSIGLGRAGRTCVRSEVPACSESEMKG